MAGKIPRPDGPVLGIARIGGMLRVAVAIPGRVAKLADALDSGSLDRRWPATPAANTS
jgi:hypothetical protein